LRRSSIDVQQTYVHPKKIIFLSDTIQTLISILSKI